MISPLESVIGTQILLLSELISVVVRLVTVFEAPVPTGMLVGIVLTPALSAY